MMEWMQPWRPCLFSGFFFFFFSPSWWLYARVIMADRPIWLLDETTSPLLFLGFLVPFFFVFSLRRT